ncbi:MAG: radical SAM protein [Thermoplasmata archaeon]
MNEYPRYVTENWTPFDPIELARQTEAIICRGKERKYTDFYVVGVYGGISTGYTVGCSLRCIFCWVDWSRDFPEKLGDFYTPEEACNNLVEEALKAGVRKARLSGAEPTLGKDHLLSLLELIEGSDIGEFVLETNGILFGIDKDYVREVSSYEKVYIRLSLKAGTADDFERKTGATKEAFEIPFQAIRNLLDCGARFHVASMSADPRFMSSEERLGLVERLAEIDPVLLRNLEEEVVDPYDTTLKRLEFAGHVVELPLRKRYQAIRDILRR